MLIFLSLIQSEEELEKFMRLYEKYHRLLLYIAYQILGDTMLAEDAVQDAFLSLSLHIDQVDDPDGSAAKYFLTTIVKNKALDILRKEKHRNETMDEDMLEQLPDNRDPLSDYLIREHLDSIVSCIRQLDDNSRVVLEYKYLHQLKEREIASLLQISPKAVNVRIFRARCRLAKILEKEGVQFEPI